MLSRTMIHPQMVVILMLCWSQAGMSLHSTELDFSVIHDPGVRNVTQELHHFCPYVDLCRENMTGELIIYSIFNPPCCKYCSCCEDEAPHYGDSCCPDVLDSLLTPEDVKETLARQTDCVHAQYRPFIPEYFNGESYTMTVNCPPPYTNSTIRQKCRTDYAELDITSDNFSSFFPVSMNRSGDLLTYKNKYCAVCSGVPEEDLLQWGIALSCVREPVLIESLTEVQRALSENQQCNLLFVEPEVFLNKLDTCNAVIDRCNVTGLWQQYDPALEAACLSYTVKYDNIFKNIHCYFCNGYSEDSVQPLCKVDLHRDRPDSFVALLDFNDLEKHEIRNEGYSCSEDEIYDPLQKICLRPHCSPMMKLNENRSSCVPTYLYANKMKFEAVFALVPPDITTPFLIMFHAIGSDIENNIMQSRFLQHLRANVCNVETFLKVNKTVEQMIRSRSPLLLRELLYVGVRLTLSTEDMQLDLQSAIGDLLELRLSGPVFPLMDILNYEIPSYLFDNATARVYELTSAAASWSSLNDMPLSATSPRTPNARAMHSFGHTPTPSTSGSTGFLPRQQGTVPSSLLPDGDIGLRPNGTENGGIINQSFKTTAAQQVHAGTEQVLHSTQGTFIIEDDRDGLAIVPLPYPATNPYSYGTSWLPITPLQFCPKIKLTGEYFTVNMLNQTVIISDLDLEVNMSQVILNLEENEITICIDTYLRGLSKYPEDRIDDGHSQGYSVQAILSVTLSCLSMICLVITQVTYVVNKNLRTLAGKNNMALVTWLFMTQFLFLIVSQVEIGTPWLCTAVGIMLHFSLLSAFSWMNVCTFHMTRVFSTIETTSVTRQSNSSAFAKYVRYALLMPIVFVGINLVVSLANSSRSEVGYGGQICYITRKEMIGYTVAIPLGFVVISDLLMFLLVVYKVNRMPDIHKNKSRERKNIVMFAKLSTLTGLTWIFGFIYQWSDVTAFAFLFIIFNASQGVFIMLAFIVNRHVITIVRGRLSSRVTQSYKM